MYSQGGAVEMSLGKWRLGKSRACAEAGEGIRQKVALDLVAIGSEQTDLKAGCRGHGKRSCQPNSKPAAKRVCGEQPTGDDLPRTMRPGWWPVRNPRLPKIWREWVWLGKM